MIDIATVQELVSRWWFEYDQGNFEALESMLTDDARFSCRTSTGTTDYEAFVTFDDTGSDAVMRRQREHRLDSPYPLRHMGQNIHRTGERDDGTTTFSSYIFVTQITDAGVSSLSTAIVTGAVRDTPDGPRICEQHVVLDTSPSVVLRTLR